MTTSAASTSHRLPLDGRVAIVTGGAGGIGSEIVAHLVSLGARVAVGYIGDPEPAERLVAALNSGGGPRRSAIAVAADVSDPAQVKALFDSAQLELGPQIHIVVTAAAIQDTTYPSVADTAVEEWERVFDVNAKGTFLCCREAANRLVRGGGGRIITVSSSSVGALRPGYAAYSATKAGVEVLTRILAKELKGTGITANSVAPGATATPLFFSGKSEEDVQAIAADNPMGRIGEPKEIAPLVGFLASDAGEWVNGQVIRVNGGYI